MDDYIRRLKTDFKAAFAGLGKTAATTYGPTPLTFLNLPEEYQRKQQRRNGTQQPGSEEDRQRPHELRVLPHVNAKLTKDTITSIVTMTQGTLKSFTLREAVISTSAEQSARFHGITLQDFSFVDEELLEAFRKKEERGRWDAKEAVESTTSPINSQAAQSAASHSNSEQE